MGSNNSKEQGKEHPVRRPQNLGSAYGYKNLIFEGGGAKASAYAGAVQVLEELKILQQIERVGGASGGALSALLVAVGMTAEEFTRLTLDTDYEKHLFDGHFGDLKNGNLGALFCSMCNISDCNMYSLFHNYGFFPGQGLLEFLRSLMKEWTGNPDITFMQLYRKYGRELCVIVSDVTTANPDYLHPKTTPDMPVAKAVQMSMSLPFVLASTRIVMPDKREHVFCDGGVFLNYPIRAFDGWFLSMKPEDSFFRRWKSMIDECGGDMRKAMALGMESTRNSEPNPETVGFRVFCSHAGDRDMSAVWLETHTELERALDANRIPVPDTTKLGSAFHKSNNSNQVQVAKSFEALQGQVSKLLGLDSDDGFIYRKTVAEKMPNLLRMYDAVDTNKDGKINPDEFTNYVENKGFPFGSLFRGNGFKPITSLPSYVNDGLISGLQAVDERDRFNTRDGQRTVPIDVRYITTTDFSLEKEDKDFIINVGRQYTKTWIDVCAKPTTTTTQES
eukprot:PhM_4_TR3465/c1_g1_i3/m.25482